MIDYYCEVHMLRGCSPAVHHVCVCQLHARICRFEQSNGVVTLEFERPLDAPSNAASDNTLAIPLDGPVTFIMARGPGNGFSSLADYHG